MKNQAKDFDLVLFQLKEFPSYFRDMNPELFLFQISCEELQSQPETAIQSFEAIYKQNSFPLTLKITMSHINLLCRQKKFLNCSSKIGLTFEKYFYSTDLQYTDKLTLLIIYFEKVKRFKLTFKCSHLNYFLDSSQSEKIHLEKFFSILCTYVFELLNQENKQEVLVIFQKLIDPVKQTSVRKYSLLKNMITVQIIKTQNESNFSMLNEFVNSI